MHCGLKCEQKIEKKKKIITFFPILVLMKREYLNWIYIFFLNVLSFIVTARILMRSIVNATHGTQMRIIGA